jgi:hypothetical protein
MSTATYRSLLAEQNQASSMPKETFTMLAHVLVRVLYQLANEVPQA